MEDIIKEYASGYEMLREAIEGLTEEGLRYKPAPDKWSIHQILIHVADSEMSSTSRLKKVLAEDEPTLISFDQDAWANNLGYDLLDREQYLLLFKLLRLSMQTILDNLTSEQTERVGVYVDQARFNFKQLLVFRVEHVRGHLAQIERVKKAYRESQGS
ncbi:putative damage-inducible protein DinB [Paenibacillus rhizosphaerae]|uniref:Putative damage-inducible protein DinB n=1 Tax=Paenibacillus rhizosphaerae TaxID=297318 RepID=A0A839TNM3_9BACL|nr:DinB family protein [Paenibacillus rhizosphaerae]MBB3128201.1 putative damage-inducible protein DinB [Paenibacillus rhizosphaerae]